VKDAHTQKIHIEGEKYRIQQEEEEEATEKAQEQ
jgi:hypothetical protein